MSDKKAQPRQECEYLAKCPMWARFGTNSKFVWIKRYCESGKQSECARKTLAARGQRVPDNLLPNGDHL